MNISKEDAEFILGLAWKGTEAERQWNQGRDKGGLALSLGPEWAVSKTREFEENRSRYYAIRDKLFPKK